MSKVANRITNLPADKLARLLQRVKKESKTTSQNQVIGKRDSTHAPLSYAQQRLCFLEQLHPGLAIFNMPFALNLKGALNLAALIDGLSEIIRRHESLRTTFRHSAGQAVQVVMPARRITLLQADLRGLPEFERKTQARACASLESQRSISLSEGPMMRVSLLRLADDEYLLLLTMHHIISDGWSMGVLFNELRLLYHHYRRGLNSPLAELEIQYGDFAAWQREWLQGEVLEQQLGYWKRKLAGAPELLELPLDKPRPPLQTYNGAFLPFALRKALSEELKMLSQRQGVTLFMTLLAAFQTLLHRCTGQDDISVGSPVAGRNPIQTEPLIGFFLNTVVMRTLLSDNPTFQELLERVRESCLGAYAHQDMPFEKLVAELRSDRSLSYSPLFQVWFVLQNTPGGMTDLDDLKLTPMLFDIKSAQYDLIMSMWEGEYTIGGVLGYNTDLFEADTIAEMLKRFDALLEGIVADPTQRILDIRLSPEDRETIIQGWPKPPRPNDTEESFDF